MEEQLKAISERIQDTGTTLREMYCIDLMDVDMVLRDVLEETFHDDDALKKAFGKHWQQFNNDSALNTALSIASEKGGWLVYAETPIPRDITFNADGTYGYRIDGSSFFQHVYGVTLGEALERAVSGAEQYIEEKISAARAKQVKMGNV